MESHNKDINFRELIDFIWRLKYWILLSVTILLLLAFIYTRMLIPVYERTTWLMINQKDGNTTEMYLLPESTNTKNTIKGDNELYIIKSPTIMSKVVDELEINYRYYHYINPILNRETAWGSIKKSEYYNDNPFELYVGQNPLYPNDLQPKNIYLEFKDQGENHFVITKFCVDKKIVSDFGAELNYGDTISLGAYYVFLRTNNNSGTLVDGRKYACEWNSTTSIARDLVKRLKAEVQGKGKNQSDIITITTTDNIPNRAEDILNTLVRCINEDSRNFKNAAIQKTIDFIDQRLIIISSELGDAENDYKNYQTSRVAIDLQSQTQMAVRGDMDYQKQLSEVQLQLRILDMISSYLSEAASGDYKVIPANVGVSDAGLINIINNYNNLVTERNRMIANSSEQNPRVLSMNHQLEDNKKAIEVSIANLLNVYGIREKELIRSLGNSQRKMAEIPQQQLELQQLSRKMEIYEPLFQLLQQKREEAQIRMYSNVDDFRVIETAFGANHPISPNKKSIFLIAFIIGCIIPPFIVLIRIFFNNKVETKKDLNKIEAPLLSCIPNSGNLQYPLIPLSGRDPSSESFRLLRSSIQYLKDTKVIQITSSIFGEGKSYVASNLALSIAHTGRRVILVGMDLRKPALHKIFPDVRFKPKNNVVGYLTGRCSRIDFAIENSKVSENLDIMMSGSIPPNPTEILSFDKQKELIEKLREKYDYVIIDSAPYLLVSDSMLINTYVDATLYIIRADFTDKRLFGEINEAINSKHKPIKNVHLVLNGLNLASSSFRYGYGDCYGYTYGIQYENTYGSELEKN